MTDADLSVAIDGIIYRLQAQGGISRVFNEILPRMCEQDAGLRITLYHSRYRQQALPTHRQVVYTQIRTLDRFLQPNRCAWGRFQPQVSDLSATAHIMVHARLGWRCIWHSTYYTTPPLWAGPKVVTVYDLCQEHFANLFTRADDRRVRRMKRHSLEQADAVLCISDSTRQVVEAYYGISGTKLHVVPLAGSEVFRQVDDPAAAPIDEPFILFVGARHHYKNFAALLDAYHRWLPRDHIALALVGSSLTDAEQQQIAARGLADRVHLLTGVDDEQLCHLYNRALAFVYPSLCEGFGIPLLEAMACGCPVVASRIPTTEEVAADVPFYFEPGQPDSLLAALDAAVAAGNDAPQVQRGIVKAATYSWDETARRVLDVYRALN